VPGATFPETIAYSSKVEQFVGKSREHSGTESPQTVGYRRLLTRSAGRYDSGSRPRRFNPKSTFVDDTHGGAGPGQKQGQGEPLDSTTYDHDVNARFHAVMVSLEQGIGKDWSN
jgi:hypothetical protein